MLRTPRPVAAATLVVVTGLALTACSSGPDESGPGASGTDVPVAAGTDQADTATTTSSTPVPGPEGEPVEVPAAVADRWVELGGAEGGLGAPAGPATEVAGGSVTDFAGGAIVLTPTGRAFVVQGEILTAYRAEGGPEGPLGFPISDETTTDGGWISAFEHGTVAFLDGRPVVEVG